MRGFFVLFALITSVNAATVNVASPPTRANFDTAYAAASAGDTILFPLNDSSTWATTATIGKALTINGNGTTLTVGTTLTNGFFFLSSFTSTALMRITGFTFNLADLTLNGHAINSSGVDLTNFRLDHNTFNHGYIQVELNGCKGVVDHNNFVNGYSCVYYSSGSRAQADASWVSMAAGTADALFFETNLFVYNTSWLGGNEHNACFDTSNGGKIVVRYNTFTATDVPVSWTGPFTAFLAHGSSLGYWQADSNARRGQSVIEFYYNTVTAKRVDYGYQARGSANLIHNNSFVTQSGFSNFPAIRVYEEEYNVTPTWDPLRVVWPAEDQVHNTFVWANTFTGGAVSPNPNYFVADGVDYIVENRDYFLHEPQSSGGSETFTGANGASSSYPTNGVVYPTQGTMTFSSSGANAYYPYTPYQYPHPLTGGTASISGSASLINATIK